MDKNKGQNKLQRYQSDQRTKKAPVNLAKSGAEKDTAGVVFVGSKGAKKFFQQRKRQIQSVNRDKYGASNDEVKLTAQEYFDRSEKRKADTHVGASSVGKLPEIKDAQEQLFDTGLKSTNLVVEAARESALKPSKASLKRTENQELRALREGSRKSLAAIQKSQLVAQEPEDGEDDNLSDNGGGDHYLISEEAHEVLARDDRNFLQRQKSYSQLKEEEARAEQDAEDEDDPMTGLR